MDEGVGVPQVVEELVAQPLALVRAGDEAGYVEELDGDGAQPAGTGAVVGFAFVLEAVACAGALDL